MIDNRPLVQCKDCKHQCGIGFDAWCELNIKKHDIEKLISCDAFVKWDYNKDNEYREIEINENGNKIILWKHDDTGQRFNRPQFIKFLNKHVNRK